MSTPKLSLLLIASLIFVFPALSLGVQTAAPQKADGGNGAASSDAGKTGTGAAPASKPAPAAAWGLLNDAAASDKFRDRSDAITALTIIPRDLKSIGMVSHALGDKEETIRTLAATSLGDMKARPAIPRLKAALDDKSPQVSFAAAQALWKMGDRSGRGIFYDVLIGERKVKPGPIKEKIQQARMDMHDPKALALIGVNQASGAFLGPFSMGVSMVEEYAKNNGTPVQALCAQLLSSDDSPYTSQQLKLALIDSNWAVRAAAARALAKLNVRSSLPKLVDMMNSDKSQPARLSAAAAVIQLSGGRPEPPSAQSQQLAAAPSQGAGKATNSNSF